MATLEQIVKSLHDAGKRVEISWLWDSGVDVSAGGEERNFPSISEVPPWLQHWYGLKSTELRFDALAQELQKIYDSEINVTLRKADKVSSWRSGTTSPDSRQKAKLPGSPT